MHSKELYFLLLNANVYWILVLCVIFSLCMYHLVECLHKVLAMFYGQAPYDELSIESPYIIMVVINKFNSKKIIFVIQVGIFIFHHFNIWL